MRTRSRSSERTRQQIHAQCTLLAEFTEHSIVANADRQAGRPAGIRLARQMQSAEKLRAPASGRTGPLEADCLPTHLRHSPCATCRVTHSRSLPPSWRRRSPHSSSRSVTGLPACQHRVLSIDGPHSLRPHYDSANGRPLWPLDRALPRSSIELSATHSQPGETPPTVRHGAHTHTSAVWCKSLTLPLLHSICLPF